MSDQNNNRETDTNSARASLNGDVRSNILKIAKMEEKAKAKRSVGEKIAEYVAAFCGSMFFVYLHIVWFGGWAIINSMTDIAFDPFPFTFLTLVVSLEAIFLSTFILISQNQETRLTERRNHLDLQINMLAEQESTKTLELVQLIANKVGVECDDEETKALLETLDPKNVVDEITEAADRT